MDRALKQEPNRADALQFRSHVLVKLNRYREAIVDIERYIELDPLEPDAHLYLAMCLQATHNNAKAVREVDTWRRLSPKDAPLLSYALGIRAMALEKLGRTSEAEKDVDRAIAAREDAGKPITPELSLLRGRLRLLHKNAEGAIEDLAAYLKSHPNDVDALMLHSDAHAVTGRYDQALVDLNRANRLRPDSKRIRFTRACVNFIRGDSDAALVDLDQCCDVPGMQIPVRALRALLRYRRDERILALAEVARLGGALFEPSGFTFEVRMGREGSKRIEVGWGYKPPRTRRTLDPNFHRAGAAAYFAR